MKDLTVLCNSIAEVLGSQDNIVVLRFKNAHKWSYWLVQTAYIGLAVPTEKARPYIEAMYADICKL